MKFDIVGIVLMVLSGGCVGNPIDKAKGTVAGAHSSVSVPSGLLSDAELENAYLMGDYEAILRSVQIQGYAGSVRGRGQVASECIATVLSYAGDSRGAILVCQALRFGSGPARGITSDKSQLTLAAIEIDALLQMEQVEEARMRYASVKGCGNEEEGVSRFSSVYAPRLFSRWKPSPNGKLLVVEDPPGILECLGYSVQDIRESVLEVAQSVRERLGLEALPDWGGYVVHLVSGAAGSVHDAHSAGQFYVAYHGLTRVPVLELNVMSVRIGQADLNAALTHEMVHYVTSEMMRGRASSLPRWVSEGMAFWLSEKGGRSVKSLYRMHFSNGEEITSDVVRVPLWATNGRWSHLRGGLVFRYLRDFWNSEACDEVCRRVLIGDDIKAAIRNTTGLSVSQFEEGFVQWAEVYLSALQQGEAHFVDALAEKNKVVRRNRLQSAIVEFPDSPLVPVGHLELGLLCAIERDAKGARSHLELCRGALWISPWNRKLSAVDILCDSLEGREREAIKKGTEYLNVTPAEFKAERWLVQRAIGAVR